MKPLAIIPARGGSKRFPRKNIAKLNGKPLISYPIAQALNSGVFGDVYVTTEDAEISKIAHDAGAKVHDRKVEHATDTAHELEAVLDMLGDMDDVPSHICVIYPTAVLVKAKDLEGSEGILHEYPDTEAIMCVSGFNYHPYKALKNNDDGYLEMMYPKECKERSQTYPHLVASNGTFYWLHVETLRNNSYKGYYQDKLRSYEIPFERAVDIDYPEDLAYVELMLKTGKS